MNKFILSLALIAIFAIIAQASGADPAPAACTYKFVGGESYDFSHIGTLTGQFNNKPVYLNFCENVSKTLCPDGDSNICAPKTGTDGDDVSFATRNKDSLPPNLTYDAATKTNLIKEHSGKAQCYSFGYMSRQLSIHLSCGSENSKTFEITDLRSSCQFETTLTVQCDGGSSGGLSGGAIFLIIFFSVLAGYFLIGFLVCKFGLKKEGIVQAIPQHQFWCALPGLYIAGIKFVIGKITGKGKGESSGSPAQYYGSTEEV